MWLTILLVIVGSVSVLSLYLMLAFLATLSMENELPDLEDVQV